MTTRDRRSSVPWLFYLSMLISALLGAWMGSLIR
jgi:hypothetical protein